jgi:hypothetical protein
VKVSCNGAAGTSCLGKLSLTLVVIKHHQRSTVKFGSTSYGVGAGASKTLQIKLSKPALKLLNRAHKHELVVTATAGSKTSHLTLIGAKPRKKK